MERKRRCNPASCSTDLPVRICLSAGYGIGQTARPTYSTVISAVRRRCFYDQGKNDSTCSPLTPRHFPVPSSREPWNQSAQSRLVRAGLLSLNRLLEGRQRATRHWNQPYGSIFDIQPELSHMSSDPPHLTTYLFTFGSYLSRRTRGAHQCEEQSCKWSDCIRPAVAQEAAVLSSPRTGPTSGPVGSQEPLQTTRTETRDAHLDILHR